MKLLRYTNCGGWAAVDKSQAAGLYLEIKMVYPHLEAKILLPEYVGLETLTKSLRNGINSVVRTTEVSQRRIDNPFKHLKNREELRRRGRDFADLIGKKCPNYPLFETAVSLAYDPPNWKSIGLTDYEGEALQKDREANFWNQPRPLQATVVALCCSAIVQGFCQSILNGSNITLPEDFGLQDEHGNWNGTRSLWIFAGLNAVVYLSAGLCGCWLSHPLQSKSFGRRSAILISSCLCFASVVGASFTTNWKQLMICRALLGCGLGAKASITPIFCAEVSPSHLRGALAINWQVWDACGIFLGFSSGLALSTTGSLSWRLQTASACIPTAALMILIWTVPESPRWLLKQSRYGDAFTSMCALRHSRLQAAAELLYANEQVQIEVDGLPQTSYTRRLETGTADKNSRLQTFVAATSYWLRIWLLFGDERIRRATVAAAVVMLCQQLCGINVLAFYGTTFFRDVGGAHSSSTPTKALWMSWGIGLANFIFAFPAYRWIDDRGRRFLLLVTYPGMILAMLGACLSLLRENESSRFVLVCTFMFIFVFFYSFGQGPVAFAYASEVFPLLNREAGMSFSVFVNLTGAGILTLLVPQYQVTQDEPDIDGRAWQMVQVRLLAVFTALNIISFILIFCFVPDTAGATIRKEEGKMNYMSLEELNYIFRVNTWEHMKEGWQRLKGVFGLQDSDISQSRYEYAEGNIFNEAAPTGMLDNVVIGDGTTLPNFAADTAGDGAETRSIRSAGGTWQRGMAASVHETEEATQDTIEPQHDLSRGQSSSSDSISGSGNTQNGSDLDVILDLANRLNGLIKDLKEKTQ